VHGFVSSESKREATKIIQQPKKVQKVMSCGWNLNEFEKNSGSLGFCPLAHIVQKLNWVA
jgi:hypothetical protein